METVGILDARNKFSALVERAENGEEVVITRHGKPVARLVGMEKDTDSERRTRARDAVRAIREMRGEVKALGDTTVKGLIEEGRRF